MDTKKLSNDNLLATYGYLLTAIDLDQNLPIIVRIKMKEWTEEIYQEILRRMEQR